jgi:hypothetical protein
MVFFVMSPLKEKLTTEVLLSYSIKPKSTWALLKPAFESLVADFVFPQLSFNVEKQKQWETDSVDYVRLSVGMSFDLHFCYTRLTIQNNRRIRVICDARFRSDDVPPLACEQ